MNPTDEEIEAALRFLDGEDMPAQPSAPSTEPGTM